MPLRRSPGRRRGGGRLTRAAVVLGVGGLATDLVLLLASITRHFVDPGGALGFLRLGRFDGNKDRTFVEIAGDLQLLLAAALLLWLAAAPARTTPRFRDTAVYGAWALVLLALGADDFFRIHEEVGRRLDSLLNIPSMFGLRSQDLGELLVWAIAATVLGALLLTAHFTSRGRPRRDSVVFFGLAILLAAFAVGLDMLNIVIGGSLPTEAYDALTHLETAGELVAMTLMMIWAVHVFTRPSDRPPEEPGRAQGGRRSAGGGAVRELG